LLPNRLSLKTINVSEVPELADGFDMLTGMDIISLGDFSISKLAEMIHAPVAVG
jgi:hypothetical protein